MPLEFHLCLSAFLRGHFKRNHEIVTIFKMHQYMNTAIHRPCSAYMTIPSMFSCLTSMCNMHYLLNHRIKTSSFFTEMYSVFVFGLMLTSLVEWSSQHGLLLSPPQRGSLWRYGYDTPPNYDDNGLFCGGLEVRQSVSSRPKLSIKIIELNKTVIIVLSNS